MSTVILVLALALICLVILFLLLTPRDRAVLFSKPQIITHNGITRSYLVSKPKQDITRIIVGLHGFGDTSARFAYYTGLHNAADQNTMVVYPDTVPPPEGYKNGWNAGFCCGSGWKTEADDAGFIIALIDSLIKENSLDNPDVYATGFSNGAFMAQRLATDYPERFKAIAAVSGSIGTINKKLEPQTPMRILLMHGEKDTVVPYSGGTGSSDPDFTWLTFDDTRKTWENLNSEKTETKVITHPDDRHKWHGWRLFNIWSSKPQASREIVNFFK